MTSTESSNIFNRCNIELASDWSYTDLTIDFPDGTAVGIVFERQDYTDSGDSDPLNTPPFLRLEDSENFNEDPFNPVRMGLRHKTSFHLCIRKPR